MIRFALLCLISLLLTAGLRAQTASSVEMSAIVSSSERTPFWLQSNRFGIYSRHGSQLLVRGQHHDRHELGGSLSVSYGADLIGRPGEASTLTFNQGYLKIGGYGFELAAGRFHNTSPNHDEELSSGSLGISRNASPIPQVRFGIPDWTPVPFTNEFAQVKAHLAHGWLGSRRYTSDVLLHEKVFHLRLGGDFPLNLYGGIAHYVKWGGSEHPSGFDIPVRWKDYASVFFGRQGDDQTPGPQQAHTLGDHLGAWDLGILLELDEYDIHLYRHFPFEDGSNLMFKSYMDALTGISVSFPERLNLPVDRILYEYLYTKFQAGPRESRGERVDDGLGPYRYNENYYNHHFYRTGWVYNRRTIGNPLFTPAENNLGVVNNRIIAHHIGFISTPSDGWKLTGKATFSRNYGKRCDNRVPDLGEGELFGIDCVDEVITIGVRSLDQWSFLAGIEAPITFLNRREWSAVLEFAFDNGRLAGDQFGALFGLRWNP
jgi:hypothetical protein